MAKLTQKELTEMVSGIVTKVMKEWRVSGTREIARSVVQEELRKASPSPFLRVEATKNIVKNEIIKHDRTHKSKWHSTICLTGECPSPIVGGRCRMHLPYQPPLPFKHGEVWTNFDDRLLRDDFNYFLQKKAKSFGRSVGAIRHRLMGGGYPCP